MVEIYGAILQKMGHAIAAPILVLVVITVAAFGIFFKLPTAFLPQEDNGFFITAFSLPEGSVNVRTNAAINDYLDYMGKIRRSNSRRASPALIFCPAGRNQMRVFPSSN